MKSYFMSRNLREKGLVLLMLAVGLVIWVSFFADRANALMADRSTLNRFNEELLIFINNRDVIRERAEAGIRNLEPSRTLNSTRLSVEANEMARKHGMNPSIQSPRTEPSDIFSNHTIVMTVNRAELRSLIDFTTELQSRAPYMSLDQVTITVRADPIRPDAQFRISAVELNR